MVYYVYSTATCSAQYITYEENSSRDIAVVKKKPNGKPMKVTINGGHGIADKHMFTPRGVVTIVEDDDMEMLLKNDNFLQHMQSGHISYDKKRVKIIKKVENMAEKDGSAPYTPADYKEGDYSSPNTHIYRARA